MVCVQARGTINPHCFLRTFSQNRSQASQDSQHEKFYTFKGNDSRIFLLQASSTPFKVAFPPLQGMTDKYDIMQYVLRAPKSCLRASLIYRMEPKKTQKSNEQNLN